MARNPYDDANQILGRHLPSLGAANTIMGSRFPAAASANRIMADRGFFPRRGSGLTAGTAGGVSSGRLTPPAGPVRRGPLFTGPRSPLAQVVADDAASGGVVNIQAWAGLMQANGISSDTILSAYEAAGGSAVLAPAEARGDTAGFLADFVQSLEHLGADPAVIVGTYQEAGGLGGPAGGQSGRTGGGGRSGGAAAGFLGGAVREVEKGISTVAGGFEHAAQQAANEIKKVFGF